jgi:2'-5' RNA ligase
MPFAVTLPLDAAAATWIEQAWRALAEQAGDDGALRLGYGPHITLAILPDDTPPAALTDAVRRAAGTWRPLTVTLAALGVFPGPPPATWAAPVVTAALLSCHASLHTALAPLSVDPHYAPDAWVPHVTLSEAAPAARAIEVLAAAWRGPVMTHLARIDVVRFRPVSLLWSAALPAA